MAEGILRARDVKKIFNDPFGLSVILHGEFYPNPNRFFSYWMNSNYFQNVPLFLQKFMNPIDSIYFSCALAKISIQVVLVYLMTIYISKSKNVFNKEFLVIACMIFPFFQTNGFNTYMGIIDQAITYNFFYSLPIVFVLLFYLPFFRAYLEGEKLKVGWRSRILLVAMILVVPFSGPLNTGIVLTISTMFFFNSIKKNKSTFFPKKIMGGIFNIPKPYFYYFLPLCFLSIYSLYIGRFSSINVDSEIPILERFLRLPLGIYFQFTQKLGFPILFFFIGGNVFLLKKYKKDIRAKKILSLFNWLLIFSIIYILVLPFGGYRIYRPNILRYDTILPLTIGFILFFSLSSYYLIQKMSRRNKSKYCYALVFIGVFFTIADEPDVGRNNCEREALQIIADSAQKIVVLKNDCTVMEYRKILTPKDSKLNGKLLYLLGVTKEEKLYYHDE